MKFLLDVHISYKIANYLKSKGFEAIHVNEILDKWNTKDQDICFYADENDLIVITKDVDFKNSHLIGNTPRKLVKVNLGNMATSTLIKIISPNMEAIERLDVKGKFLVELDLDKVTFITKEDK
ncbi:DUF5615 family PIN-like protein [Autumnicola edwardsiae]|uniref:DUF5615 family PIN-like protein n=1 Tax=Autumnicola edwardsiae TaxID=3075594 RepID=A0ABU3CXB9_9FLAO|nr:DUF5615 family PIN-like protein [Zunongwangia sp. F297]MDT0651007.1 DUF5615 family PIN-like protein [Zunongwangia sp. F297]